MESYTCVKAAILSDIHSNFSAFRACVNDAMAENVDLFIFLGDYVSDLAQPREVLDLLYRIKENYPTICLRGNRERYMLQHDAGEMAFSEGSKSGSLLYTFQNLSREDLAFFAQLPIYRRVELNGVPFELAHAGKEDDRFYFDHHSDLIPIFSDMTDDFLLCGHCHKQYLAQKEGKTILNPGSVGGSQNGDRRACYALLQFESGKIQPILRQVDYDLAATVHAQFESGLTQMAPTWAVSVLYDIITGQECTLEILKQVADPWDESQWRKAAEKMGVKFSKGEILTLLI